MPIDLGRGVKIARVVSATPQMVKVEVDVARCAYRNARSLRRGRLWPGAPWCTTRSTRIKVLPQAGMARIGGINFPKQYQQFEAIA